MIKDQSTDLPVPSAGWNRPVMYDANGEYDAYDECTKFEGDMVAELFVKHFHNFHGTVDNVTPIVDADGLFENKLNDNKATDMICDMTDAEIKNEVLDIDDAKGLGPDGFTSAFFKNAFVPGKLIQDNLLLTQELLKGYNCKNGPKSCALKVDIAKAYDTLSWEFLESILKQIGFHNKMIQWIMTCVTTALFTIFINGESHGYFKSGRGLRQGDPISPYLFTFVMEVCSLKVARKVALNHAFKYHKDCKELKLTYLSFANDLLVMSHGDKQRILEVLPFQTSRLPVKYLGIPLLSKNGISDCKVLVDKVRNKVNDWKYKTLSYAGRLQLITSVLSAMQTYWASGKGSKGKAKLLGLWYVVLKVKWVNRVKLKGKSFWEASVECNDSGTWKALLDLRGNIRPHIFHDIGNRSSTSTWHDTRHSVVLLSSFINSRSLYDARLSNSCTVSDMVRGNVWTWLEEWNSQFPILNQIITHILHSDKNDAFKWKTKNGNLIGFSGNLKKRITTTDLPDEWDQTVQAMGNFQSTKSIWNILKKIGIATCVYYIWKERNDRIFTQEKKPYSQVLQSINENIRLQLMSLTIKKSTNSIRVVELWEVKFNFME
ncbi:RNA-directed DNA polymerase, eukaryota, reverse transcriptase zinc-binding domain protein [Tanacetum coccineum]